MKYIVRKLGQHIVKTYIFNHLCLDISKTKGEVRIKGRNCLPLTSTVVTCSLTKGTLCLQHVDNCMLFCLLYAPFSFKKKNQVLGEGGKKS